MELIENLLKGIYYKINTEKFVRDDSLPTTDYKPFFILFGIIIKEK